MRQDQLRESMHVCTHFAVSGGHLATVSILPMVIQKTTRPHLRREQVRNADISLYKARQSARELSVDTVSHSAPVADGRQGLFMRCHATRPNSERVLLTGDKLDGTVDRHLGSIVTCPRVLTSFVNNVFAVEFHFGLRFCRW